MEDNKVNFIKLPSGRFVQEQEPSIQFYEYCENGFNHMVKTCSIYDLNENDFDYLKSWHSVLWKELTKEDSTEVEDGK